MADPKPENAQTASDNTDMNGGSATVSSAPAAEEKQGEAEAVVESKEETSKPAAETTEAKKQDTPKRKPFNRFKKNIKSDFSSLPESSDHDEIRKQVEFYFSDSNLVQDQFLLEQVGGNQNTPVPVRIIHSFKRMRHFQPYEEVVKALRDSTVLNVNDDDEVFRKEPLPESVTSEVNRDTIRTFVDKAQPRSVYAKGFGEEGPSTQVDIEELFAPYGPINAVRLRRTSDKKFKGSVFVEFKDEDTQKAFLALEKKPTFQGEELLIMGKKEYVDMKAEDIRTGKIKPSESRNWKADREQFQKNGFKDGRGRGRGGRGNRGGRGGRGGARNDRNGRDREEDGDASKKRSRDEDGEGEPPDAKKGKTEEAAET